MHGTLLYRNQYVLGPRRVELDSWRTLRVRSDVVISAHPDLLCCQSERDGKSLTLLGFILDPENPTRTDQDIVDELFEAVENAGLLTSQTFRFGGRWALVADDGNRIVVFNDAAGMRQVFYARDPRSSAVWCASQPAMLANICDAGIGPEALALINSFGFRQDREYWWPGDGSPFVGVRHLLPNHMLDLTTGTVQRYWPDRDVPERRLDDVLDRIAGTLLGMMQSAAHRFDLTLGITAGWDSRLVLAASRNIARRLSFATVRQLSMRDDHPDVAVPSSLLSRLGLRHEVIRSSLIVDPEFIRLFKSNYVLAHDHYLADAHAIYVHNRLHRVAVTGSLSEVVRDPTLGKPSITAASTPRDIADAWYGVDVGRYAAPAIGRWLAHLGELHNISRDVAFYWEQRAGNWLAMNQLEFDIAWKETVVPFNSRSLLIDMLSVPQAQRGGRRPTLYVELIRRLWPEALCEPINPHRTPSARFAQQCRRIVRALRTLRHS